VYYFTHATLHTNKDVFMKNRHIIAGLMIVSSFTCLSQEVNRIERKETGDGKKYIEIIPEAERSDELEISDKSGQQLFSSVINNTNLPTNVIDVTADFIELLLSKRKVDTDLLYNFVIGLNANISTLNQDQDEDEDIKDIKSIINKLRVSSYTDRIHYNTNLANQLRVRMPILLSASAKLSDTSIDVTVRDFLKKDFLDELSLFSDKYLKSSRFQAGLGISYSYSPVIQYTSRNLLDLTPFSQNVEVAPTSLRFDQSFANQSYLNFEIAAKLAWGELGLSIPKYSETSTIQSPVSVELLSGSETEFAVYRSTIQSQLEIEYDFSVRIPILSNYKRIRYSRYRNSQFDYGLMAGVTGFQITDSVTTDLRFRNDNIAFNQLAESEILTSTRSVNFQSLNVGAYLEFEFVDELYMTLDIKWHGNNSSDESRIDVDGFTTSLRLIYAPTLDFLEF
jgi:hypothetical protein